MWRRMSLVLSKQVVLRLKGSHQFAVRDYIKWLRTRKNFFLYGKEEAWQGANGFISSHNVELFLFPAEFIKDILSKWQDLRDFCKKKKYLQTS